jgi:hypothetical protein
LLSQLGELQAPHEELLHDLDMPAEPDEIDPVLIVSAPELPSRDTLTQMAEVRTCLYFF